jgi:hypothetical protein
MESCYHRVSDLLDTAVPGALPKGARGQLYAAADLLARARAPFSHVAMAERAAFLVQWIEFARRHSASVDESAARRELSRLRLSWRAATGARAAAPLRQAA